MAKKVKIELDFDIGDSVWLKTDPEFLERMVVHIKLLPGELAVYGLAYGADEVTEHYPIEMLDKKPVE
jgi:hypothetical protein